MMKTYVYLLLAVPALILTSFIVPHDSFDVGKSVDKVDPDPEETRQAIRKMREEAMGKLYEYHPQAKKKLPTHMVTRFFAVRALTFCF